jgi:hypothetical protein
MMYAIRGPFNGGKGNFGFFQFIAVLICFGSVLFGAYMGLWWSFVGGIIDIIKQIRADEIDGYIVGLAVLKVLFFQLVGFFCALPGMLIAAGIGSVGR